MIEVRLDNEEWQRVLTVLSQGQWAVVNPLIMKIGGQLQAAQAAQAGAGARPNGRDDDELGRKPLDN